MTYVLESIDLWGRYVWVSGMFDLSISNYLPCRLDINVPYIYNLTISSISKVRRVEFMK